MNPISTTLREILSTGKLGHLYAGMKREIVAALMPELNPPDGRDLWSYGGVEIFFREDAVSAFKMRFDWYDVSLPPSVKVRGFVPSSTTSLDEFCAYLEAENLQYQLFWNSWGDDRWPVLFVEDKAKIPFGEDDLIIIAVYFSSSLAHEKALSHAEQIALNIYDLLKAHISEGKLLNQKKYKPASVQIFEPNDFYPDVSYLKSSDRDVSGMVLKGVPRLAVIVVKPNMDDANLKWQISIYLSEGTKQVWLVYPKTKELHQYSSDTPNQIRNYRGAESIDAESLFPNIQGLNLSAIFKMPKWAIKEKE